MLLARPPALLGHAKVPPQCRASVSQPVPPRLLCAVTASAVTCHTSTAQRESLLRDVNPSQTLPRRVSWGEQTVMSSGSRAPAAGRAEPAPGPEHPDFTRGRAGRIRGAARTGWARCLARLKNSSSLSCTARSRAGVGGSRRGGRRCQAGGRREGSCPKDLMEFSPAFIPLLARAGTAPEPSSPLPWQGLA